MLIIFTILYLLVGVFFAAKTYEFAHKNGDELDEMQTVMIFILFLAFWPLMVISVGICIAANALKENRREKC